MVADARAPIVTEPVRQPWAYAGGLHRRRRTHLDGDLRVA
jgi:hypothetical protein